jgi:guanine deaminase
VIQSFVSQNQRVGITQATYTKGLYRATLAGAEILKVHKKSGNLTPGKEANLVVLPQVRKRLDDTSESVLKRLMNGKKRRLYDGMISHTYYRGELVSRTA